MEFALTSPSIYAKAVVEDGMSMIFYTSAAEDEEKLINWVSRFIRHVLNYQERHKRPLLLILEEAQEYAPRSASGHIAPPWIYNRMIKAFKDCFTQGRKLNLIAIASSQRPQELNFTIRQLANLTFFGKFSDQDIGYVDKECLKYIRKQGIEVDASRLVNLGLGEWLVIMGKHTRFITVTEPRLTKHGAETPRLEYVAPRTTKAKKTIDQLTKTIVDALKREEAEKSELEKAKRQIRDLKKKLLAAEEKAKIKLAVKDMLQGDGDAEKLAEKLAKAEEEKTHLEQEIKDQQLIIVDLEGRVKLLKKFELFDEALTGLIEAKLPTFIPTAGPPGLEPGSTKIVHTEIVPEIQHKVEYPIVETNEKTMFGRLITLASKGFFKEKQKISEISREITRVFAVSVNMKDVNKALTKVIQLKILEREKDSHKAWVYWLVPGAQERIKEAEA